MTTKTEAAVPTPLRPQPARWGVALAAALVLAGCGGGGDDAPISVACDLPSQRSGLRDHLRSWYYYNAQMPDPVAAGFSSITDYYAGLLYTSSNFPGVSNPSPAFDRWSYVQDSASYNQFFGEGQSLGYGLFVAGQAADPLPLRVRYVTPGSPADAAGLRRGMVIDSINGVAADQLKATGNFSALSPAAEGVTVDLMVRDTPAAPTPRALRLTANTHTLTPVSQASVLTSPGSRKVAYLHYKDFIAAGQGPTLQSAFASFRAQGATEMVLDMRYNGGGRISVSQELASRIVGSSRANQAFTTLTFNAQHRAEDFTYQFQSETDALALNRVMVLAGPRTCSASELVVNGLRGVGVNAVLIGTTTCGKPFGFRPYEQCGNTYSAVNFRSVNAQGRADYDTGMTPTCTVADDFDHPQGDPAERLTAAALSYIDTGACPVASAREQAQAVRPRSPWVNDGDRPPGMWAR